jgi:glycosyltransferase involved in cell wall biosynthesis
VTHHSPVPAPLLLHVFPSFAVGGAQVRFAAIANRFGPRWRHAVVALDGKTDCAARLGPEVEVALLPAPFPRGAGPVARLRAIARMLREVNPALLVTSNWGSIEWAAANRAGPRLPHLHMEDGFGPEERTTQLRRRVLARRLVLHGSPVLLPSNTLARVAREQWRLPQALLVPNGIDLHRFHPAPRALPPGEAPLIGTAAALRPEKNLARLLRALALLHGEGLAARLLILGDGPERGRLEALAAELGLGAHVTFAGHVAAPEAAYRGMDLFCLSSDTEQMPFSVLEAMASGLAVASTDVGDVKAMLAPENLPHVAAPDDAALAAALRPLVQDAALRATIGQANRARAERDFDEEAMFQAHAALIDRVAGLQGVAAA